MPQCGIADPLASLTRNKRETRFSIFTVELQTIFAFKI